ncbi:hypothetical protein F5Y11DRAFT_342709 [Daldinia sp. FL1419]|nr:hypothetical protein F5Y11DRAFT_342709 [Daldinia sp. FL1419]
MHRMLSIELGSEYRTGVVLVISTGNRPVYNIDYREPGIKEGLVDMAPHGFSGKMILYGLAFEFKRSH